MALFLSLLCLLAVKKGFEISYCWQYMKNGTVICPHCFRDRKFILGAVFAVLLFGAVAFIEKWALTTVCLVDLISTCIFVSLIDLKYKQIPDIILILLLISQMGMAVHQYGLYSLENVIWCVAVFIVALLISVLSKGKMGMGDVKLLSVICFSLGVTGIIWVTIIALILSLIVGLYLMIIHKKSIKTELPFAPFMTLSILINLIVQSFYS